MKVYDMTHADKVIVEHPICPPLLARMGTGGNQVPLVLGSAQANAAILSDGTCPTLTAQMGTGGNNMPLVLMNPNGFANFAEQETSGTITTQIGKGVTGSQPLILMDQGGNRMDVIDGAVGTLRSLGHVPLVLMDQGGGVMSVEHDKVGTLRAQTHGHEPLVLAVHENQLSECRLSDKMNSITNPGSKPGQGNPVILQEAYRISSDGSNVMRSSNPLTGYKKAEIAPTLDMVDPSPSKGQGGIAIVTKDVPHCFKIRSGCNGGGEGYLGQDDKSFTLATNNDQYLMTQDVIPINTQTVQGRPSDNGRMGSGIGKPGDPSNTLQAAHSHGVFAQARVRKLTPRECERLQGFPDNWTQIPWKGKPAEECPDSPRYKAIGNSWAVPCVRWIGKRIQNELEKNK